MRQKVEGRMRLNVKNERVHELAPASETMTVDIRSLQP